MSTLREHATVTVEVANGSTITEPEFGMSNYATALIKNAWSEPTSFVFLVGTSKDDLDYLYRHDQELGTAVLVTIPVQVGWMPLPSELAGAQCVKLQGVDGSNDPVANTGGAESIVIQLKS